MEDVLHLQQQVNQILSLTDNTTKKRNLEKPKVTETHIPVQQPNYQPQNSFHQPPIVYHSQPQSNSITELVLPRKISCVLFGIVGLLCLLILGGGFFVTGIINELQLHHHDPSNQFLVKDLSLKRDLTKQPLKPDKNHDQEVEEEEEEENEEGEKLEDEMFIQILNTESLQKLYSKNNIKNHSLKPKKDQCNNKNLIFKTIKLNPNLDKCKPIKSSVDISTCCVITIDGGVTAHICKDDPPLIFDSGYTLSSFCLSCNIFMKQTESDHTSWWMVLGLSEDYINTTITNFDSSSECTIKINAVCMRYFCSFLLFFFSD